MKLEIVTKNDSSIEYQVAKIAPPASGMPFWTLWLEKEDDSDYECVFVNIGEIKVMCLSETEEEFELKQKER